MTRLYSTVGRVATEKAGEYSGALPPRAGQGEKRSFTVRKGEEPGVVRSATPGGLMKLVCWLQDLGKDTSALAGGKAANLGELLRAGLDVPPGFVVTTAAYEHFVAANGLQPEIERLAGAPHPEDAARAAAAQALSARFAAGAVPDAVAAAVR